MSKEENDITHYAKIIENLCSPRKVRNVYFIANSEKIGYEYECLKSGNFENSLKEDKETLEFLQKELNGKSIDEGVKEGIEAAQFYQFRFTCCNYA